MALVKIRKLIPRFLKKGIKRRLFYKYHRPVIVALNNSKNKKRLILLLTPTHGNIGDHAIAYCEQQFLSDHFEEYIIVEIPDTCWEYEKTKILGYIRKDDCLLITGGGFMGTLWEDLEQKVRDIINTFPNNKIVIFPQSIYFSDDRYGQEQCDISRNIYTQHSRLFLCAREKNSYECVKNNQLLKDMNNCFLMPDIVTYYKGDFSKYARNNKVLLCLRSDKEKITASDTVDEIVYVLSDAGLEYSYTDTVLPCRVFANKRNEELFKKLKEFAQCKFIITDRLHGMILSAVIGTPCLFMDNCSRKVSGTYEWIQNLEYIKPLKDINSLKAFISQLEDRQVYHYSNEHLQSYYIKLAEIIKEF